MTEQLDEGPVIVTRADLMAGILVGIGGEHDLVPSTPQLERAADLIIRRARRREAGLDRLRTAIASGCVPTSEEPTPTARGTQPEEA